jgi:RHS repeat-associated protein
MKAFSREGFTGQEMIGGNSMSLVHMNGRVLDSITGRFLSADSYVNEPGNTQDFNRYSYVHNNPLSFTDPSGFAAGNDENNGYEGAGVVIVAQRIEPDNGNSALDYFNKFIMDWLNHAGPGPTQIFSNYVVSVDAAKTRGQKAQSPPCSTSSAPTSNAAAVPFTDDQGNPVADINGNPMQRPAGWDPHFFTAQGAADGSLGALQLPNFRIGGSWDAQRVGGSFYANFVDFASRLVARIYTLRREYFRCTTFKFRWPRSRSHLHASSSS